MTLYLLVPLMPSWCCRQLTCSASSSSSWYCCLLRRVSGWARQSGRKNLRAPRRSRPMSRQSFLWKASVVKQPVQQRPLSQSQMGKMSSVRLASGLTLPPKTSPMSVTKQSVGLPQSATTRLHFSRLNCFMAASMTAQEYAENSWKSCPKQRRMCVLFRMRFRKPFSLLRCARYCSFVAQKFSSKLPPMNWSSNPWIAHRTCVGSAPYVRPLAERALHTNSVLFCSSRCSSERSTRQPSTPRCARMASEDCECPKESAEMAVLGKQPNSSFRKRSPSSKFSTMSSQQAHPSSCSTKPPPRISQNLVLSSSRTLPLVSRDCCQNQCLKKPISELKKERWASCVLLAVSLRRLLSQRTSVAVVKICLTEVKRLAAKQPRTSPSCGCGSQQLSKLKIQQASRCGCTDMCSVYDSSPTPSSAQFSFAASRQHPSHPSAPAPTAASSCSAASTTTTLACIQLQSPWENQKSWLKSLSSRPSACPSSSAWPSSSAREQSSGCLILMCCWREPSAPQDFSQKGALHLYFFSIISAVLRERLALFSSDCVLSALHSCIRSYLTATLPLWP